MMLEKEWGISAVKEIRTENSNGKKTNTVACKISKSLKMQKITDAEFSALQIFLP